jgi:DNA-binding transcriptional MerR regulator
MMRLGPKENRDILKIGELAEELGTTTRTIRFYEEEGLLEPARTEKGTRLYAKKDVLRLNVSLRLSNIGVPIEQIKTLATARETCSTGSESSKTVVPLLNDLRLQLENASHEIEQLMKELERADMLVRQCSNCPNKPNRKDCPTCPVDVNIEQTDIARLVWDPLCP